MSDPEFLAALRASASEVLDDQCPAERVHRHIDGDEPFAADLWRTVVELGWTTIALPEDAGGMGGGVAELAVLQEALGGRVAPLPFLGTALIGIALAAWPDQGFAGGLMQAVAGGEVVGGVADLASGAPLRLNRTAGGLALDGAVIALDAAAADWLLISVEDAPQGERGLALLSAAALGVERTARLTADRTRPLVTVTCREASVEPSQLMLGAAAAQTRAQLVQAARLLLAADSVGGAEAILAVTVEYLKTRVQFGRPIGSFQALKHRAADLKVSLEMSRAVLGAALDGRAAATAPDWPAMAKASACETYLAVASEAVQMHGGIGFTWEHQAHLYLKRATLNRALFGDTAALQDRIAASLVEYAA